MKAPRRPRPDRKRLHLAIQHDGRSKGEIAEAAGIANRQVLTNILGGRGGGTHTEKLAAVLNVNPRWLTHGENPPAWHSTTGAVVTKVGRTVKSIQREIDTIERYLRKTENTGGIIESLDARLSALEMRVGIIFTDVAALRQEGEEAGSWKTPAEVRAMRRCGQALVWKAIESGELASEIRRGRGGKPCRLIRVEAARAWNPRGAQ